MNDRVWWIGAPTGVFSVKLAYHIIRKRRNKVNWHNLVWSRWLSHKIFFIMWRVINKNIPTNDVLKRLGMFIVYKCGCCDKRWREK